MEMDGTVPKWSVKEVNETLNVKGSDWRPSSAFLLLVPQLLGSFLLRSFAINSCKRN